MIYIFKTDYCDDYGETPVVCNDLILENGNIYTQKELHDLYHEYVKKTKENWLEKRKPMTKQERKKYPFSSEGCLTFEMFLKKFLLFKDVESIEMDNYNR